MKRCNIEIVKLELNSVFWTERKHQFSGKIHDPAINEKCRLLLRIIEARPIGGNKDEISNTLLVYLLHVSWRLDRTESPVTRDTAGS